MADAAVRLLTNPIAGDAQHAEGNDWNYQAAIVNGTGDKIIPAALSVTGGAAYKLLAINSGNTAVAFSLITDSHVDSSAAIAKSKIATSGTWVKADLPGTVPYTDQANTFAAGFKQTFTTTASVPALNIIGIAGDPSTVVDGDIWYNTTTGRIRYRNGSVSRSMVDLAGTNNWTGSNTITNTNLSITGLAASLPVVTNSGGFLTTAALTSGSIAANDPLLVKQAKYTIRKNGSNYEAIDDTTGAITTDTDFASLMNTIIGTGSVEIFVKKSVNAQTAKITLATGTKITFEKRSTILLPNGYTGSVFEIDSLGTRIEIEGGVWDEAGTPSKLWTGLFLNSTTNGIYFNKFRNMDIANSGVGILLASTGSAGWINSNDFENILVNTPIVGVEFRQLSTLVTNGTNYNNFKFVNVQSDANTLYCFKNISGSNHIFLQCVGYDIVNPGITSNITAQGSNIQIIGGAMTTTNFADLGSQTRIIGNTQLDHLIGRFVGTTSSLVAGLNLGAGRGGNPTTTISGDMWLLTNNAIEYKDSSGSIRALIDGNLSQTLDSKLLASACKLVDATDTTKRIAWSLSGMTTGKTLTLANSQTNSFTLTIPNITANDNIVTTGIAQTFIAAMTFPASGIILGGAGAGLSTLTYANSASSTTFTIPATTGTAALLAQLTDGSTITGLVNAQIAAGAAIAYSKLALTTSIVNGDISTSAAIAKSKISTSGTWVEADLPATTIFTDVANTMLSALTFTTKLLKVADVSDSNANISLACTATASAVDYITIVNAATANPATVQLNVTGSDSNINLSLQSKGTGKVLMNNTGDTTKIIAFDPSGQTTGTTYTLAMPLITANRTLNFPLITASDTLPAIGLAQTWTVRQTFVPTGSAPTNAPINIVGGTSITTDPSGNTTGDLWINGNILKFRTVTGNIACATANLNSNFSAVQSCSAAFTFAGTVNAPIVIVKSPTAPTGGSSEFIGGYSNAAVTTAFATTPQTGDFVANRLDKTTLTNPSSGTVPNASTLKLIGGPVASTNVVITNKYALWVAADNARFDGLVILTAQADPAAAANQVWLSSTNTDLLKHSNASILLNIVDNVTGRSTAQTAANSNVLTYTVPAQDSSYIVSANVLVTASTTHSFTVTIDYTDEGNTARTVTVGFTQLTGSTIITAITNITGTGPYEGIPIQLRCKASTSIIFKTAAGGTYTSVTYNVEGHVTRLA